MEGYYIEVGDGSTPLSADYPASNVDDDNFTALEMYYGFGSWYSYGAVAFDSTDPLLFWNFQAKEDSDKYELGDFMTVFVGSSIPSVGNYENSIELQSAIALAASALALAAATTALME